ncbi:MAG: hypothetical protein EOP45_18065 [Sphingobacteriaceae bacterium]|nr:MAG: hypothetical protein EOP45_18065 [Sphingobacteriaceae bacterium]
MRVFLKENQEAFVELMATSETEFSFLGTITSGNLKVDDTDFGSIKEAFAVHNNVLHTILGE